MIKEIPFKSICEIALENDEVRRAIGNTLRTDVELRLSSGCLAFHDVKALIERVKEFNEFHSFNKERDIGHFSIGKDWFIFQIIYLAKDFSKEGNPMLEDVDRVIVVKTQEEYLGRYAY